MLIELYSPDIKYPIKGGYEYYYRGGVNLLCLGGSLLMNNNLKVKKGIEQWVLKWFSAINCKIIFIRIIISKTNDIPYMLCFNYIIPILYLIIDKYVDKK